MSSSRKPSWGLLVLPTGEVWLNDHPDVRHGYGICIGAGRDQHASLLDAREELRAHLDQVEAHIARLTTTPGGVS